MRPANESSASSSATTSTTAPPSGRPGPQPSQVPSGVTGTRDDRQKAAEKTLSESAYLAHQANEAKAAIGAALDDLKKSLANGVNPVGWAKQYPWIAVGAGAVAGFVATSLLVPSKEE